MTQDLAQVRHWLFGEAAACLARAVSAMAGEEPRVEAGSRTEPRPGAPPLRWRREPLTAAPGAAVWIGFAEAGWEEIGRRALAAAGVEEATPEDCRSTFSETLSQALGALASAVGGRLGRDVAAGGGQDGAPEPDPSAAQTPVSVRFADGTTMEGAAAANAELLGAFAEQAGAAEPPAATAAAAPRTAADNSKTFGLLLEVELPVSVSFGRAQLPLRDVLKLTTGSIVELNRSVSEPVEVIVNNCVIARGEVVVIEGNYGVRVREIISREERLRTLN